MNEPKLRFKADDGSDYPELTVAKLDDLCEKIGDGLHGTPIYSQTGNYYFINGNNLENGKIIVSSDTPKVNDSVFEKNNKELNDSTILMSINGTIGKVAYYNNEKVMLGKSVAYFKVNYKCIKEYCYQLIQTANVQCQFQKGLTGSTIKNLGLNTIKNTNVKVSCLPEQQKIAEFLSTIDTVIEKQKETVSAWEERKKGVMQKLFSQEVRFKADDGSDFPEWEEKKISECTKFVKDGTHGTHKNVSNGHPLLSAKDIFDNIVHIPNDSRLISDEDYNKIFSKYDLQDGDVLITIVGTLGRTALVTDTCKHVAFQRSVGIMRPDKSIVDSNYLKAVCDVAHFQNELEIKKNKGAQAGVYLGVLSSIEISVPCLEEQQKIADCLSSLDEVIEKQKATLAAWEALKKGLLQQMFV